MKLELHTNHDEALAMVIALVQNDKTYDMAIAIMRQAEIDRDEVFEQNGNIRTWFKV
jgi:hypothetical protein